MINKKTSLLIVLATLSFSLIGCGEDSTTGSGTSSAEDISSAASSSSKITCELAEAVPEWYGSPSMDWQENVGKSCYAIIKTTKADVKVYEDSLGKSRWASAQGWIASGATSAITYTRKMNSDTSYTLSISCDTAKSTYAFTLSTALIVYNSDMERMVGGLPEWNGSAAIAWTVDSESGSTNQINISMEEEKSYEDLLLEDGWAIEESPFVNQRWYTKTFKTVEYLLSFTIVQGGLVEIGMEEF